MNRVMSLIGSSSGCKFRLADPSVSSFHCNLLRTHVGLWIIDLLGSSGIVVNDASVRYAQLNDNDVLGVGRYRIRIRCRFAYPVPDHQDSSRSRQSPVVFPQRASPATRNYHISMTNPDTVNSSMLPARPMQASVPELMSLFQVPRQSPGFEWTSTGGNELAGMEKPEVSETLLIPLMNQFGHMQQQMLDQFQQAIATLVQMFGTLHRDQMQTIREELDQIRDLTKEFQSLKVELAARTEGRPEAVSTQFGVVGVPGDDAVNASQVQLQTDSASSSQVPRTNANDPASSHEASPNVNSDAPAIPNVAPDTPQLDQRETANPQSDASTPEASLDSDRDVVIWLHQRMMTLQKERETRWQRILKLLPGLS
jgi:hypothetical protein